MNFNIFSWANSLDAILQFTFLYIRAERKHAFNDIFNVMVLSWPLRLGLFSFFLVFTANPKCNQMQSNYKALKCQTINFLLISMDKIWFDTYIPVFFCVWPSGMTAPTFLPIFVVFYHDHFLNKQTTTYKNLSWTLMPSWDRIEKTDLTGLLRIINV